MAGRNKESPTANFSSAGFSLWKDCTTGFQENDFAAIKLLSEDVMNFIRRLLIFVSLLAMPMAVSAQGLDTAKIDQALSWSGQKIGDVYKVGFPRTDLQVSVHGLAIRAGLALGSWAAFTGTDDHAMVMGDLVLLEDELNPVMEKLRSAGFEISAVHNHLIEET